MNRINRRKVEHLAWRILAQDPDPVVRYRLLAEVLSCNLQSREVQAAHRACLSSPQVRTLAKEQWSDGSWGRLHSVNTRARQRIGTTEAGVERGLTLGLTAEHHVLASAANYLASVLRRERTIRDPEERNDRWPAGVQLFAGATLSRIDGSSRELDALWARWAQILKRAFSSGTFDGQAEIDAHAQLHDVHNGVRYLGLANRYTVMLLSARANRLPPPLRKVYWQWLWQQPNGLGYIGVRCWPAPTRPAGHAIAGWLHTLDLLIRYQVCLDKIRMAIEALWAMRNEDDLWDFGPTTTRIRFSSDWRQAGARAQDHSLMALLVTSRFLGSL